MTNLVRYRTLDANEAVAEVAYRLSEVIAIYPITPASIMGEHADAWSADRRVNLWGTVPEVVEMQSEGGAAGAVHGALSAGALTTTFTASQGLLLMLPDLFKIAGELTSFCMHVAARTVATHALSIFGDHSDVMAARSTGMALLASGSAQEAQDLAAIGHAVTLRARVPVLHFFDGFRTSHEITKVVPLEDDSLRALVDDDGLRAHRARALDPDRPVVRGTSQNPDAYFQSREAVEPFYARFPDALDETMARFAELTGRRYQPFDYVGHPEAERVVVLMGSGAESAHELVEHLVSRGEKVGVIKVRLFRPFSTAHLLAALPASVRSLAVLDRTKEPGSSGEPLYQELTSALVEANARGERSSMPRIVSGRYGLASKDLTPAMLRAVFEDLAVASPKHRFTVGIRDDVSQSSLAFDASFDIEPDDVSRALFFGLGADGTVSANKATIKIIGEETPLFAQGHFEYDSRKAGSTTISHLRFGPKPIRSTYRIARAQFIAIHDPEFLERRDVLAAAMPGATVLLNTSLPGEKVWDALPREVQARLVEQRCRLFVIDVYGVAERAGLGRRINTVMQICFFSLAKVLPLDEAMKQVRRSIEETWGRRGPEVVERNVAALEAALGALRELPVPSAATAARTRRPAVPPEAPDFNKRTAALRLPLFEFSGACAGCGETPYLRLLTQLFGDHLIIANATGCSSIYGGNLPTTPYTTNAEGRGPAWSNSLFEDNAEFGLGMRLAVDVRAEHARTLLKIVAGRLPAALVDALLSPGSGETWIAEQRRRVKELDALLSSDVSPESVALRELSSALVPRSVWIVGGDGWAYDIGYGGLDHVLASHKNVNVLVLDTEVYSNTGGQQSKATPLGASAKFATAGKSVRKKDLGLLAMSYGHVYVAQVAMQARSAQAVEALLEAERHPGPSLVIAHSPCIAHGYDLVSSPLQQKRAIASGMWPLYRFDPKRVDRGEAPLVLDSGSETLDVGAYMESEARFRMVELRDPERYAHLVDAARDAVRQRRALYEQLARIHLPKENSHA